MDAQKLAELLFPHDSARENQSDFISDVENAVKNRRNLIANAPVGLGKTAAALAPALSYALKSGLKVFFLTSRHTQHHIAVDTLKKIRQKYGQKFIVADIIGKKAMCIQPGAELLYTRDFHEFCNSMVETNRCEFYSAAKSGNALTARSYKALDDLKGINPSHAEDIIELSRSLGLCPYEIASALSQEASVVITDYNYIFNEQIRNMFFKKARAELGKSIIIVDEAHNLSDRVRSMMSESLSSQTLARAVKEAKKYKLDETLDSLVAIQDILNLLSRRLGNKLEALVGRSEFIESVNGVRDYEQMIEALKAAADLVREKQKRSFIGSVSAFLEAWKGPDEGFARIISRKGTRSEPITLLSYRCLDPSIVTREVINGSHSTILMSGTLTPVEMYRDLFGIERCDERSYESPFERENRLNLVVPLTTTRKEERSEEQYRQIGAICSDVVDLVQGCSALFFPSYELKDAIGKYVSQKCRKTVFQEMPRMTKQEKAELLENFKTYKSNGAVLLAVVGGSFSEGIDMPGILKSIVVVGIPFQQLDLETEELIKYYDKKFGKGREYGYIFPAINKAIQAAGRGIRTEDDRCACIFLDKRYSWSYYLRCFPPDSRPIVSTQYQAILAQFFDS